MPFAVVTRQQVADVLRSVGVQAGDGLLVHSALQFLGHPAEGVSMYLDALQEVIGAAGTLAVPTFNFGFGRGEDYDPALAPAVKMGAFSEYVRQHPEARRTSHPMQSFAVIGKHAQELASLDTPCAFDDGSAVDRMLQLGFKLVLLGADIQAASIFHYSEQRSGVPYRYWKKFSGRVRVAGEWQERTCRMYVRDLDINPRLEVYEIQHILESRGLWQARELNYGYISSCKLSDYVAVANELLAENPWRFVTNPPWEV